jgi:hypothetical protein
VLAKLRAAELAGTAPPRSQSVIAALKAALDQTAARRPTDQLKGSNPHELQLSLLAAAMSAEATMTAEAPPTRPLSALDTTDFYQYWNFDPGWLATFFHLLDARPVPFPTHTARNNQPSISGFTNNILIGTNAFLDTIIAPTIWSGGTGLNCPTANNAGEGIVVLGGEMFNLVKGAYNAGCSLTFFGTHFDAITGTALALNEGLNGAETDCTSCYVELMVQPASGAVLSVTGYDAGGSIEWIGGQI